MVVVVVVVVVVTIYHLFLSVLVTVNLWTKSEKHTSLAVQA